MTREELKQEAEELIQRFEMANSMNCYMSLTPDRKQIGEMLVMIAEPREKRIAEQEELLNSTLEENKDIYKKMADLDTSLEDCTESLTDARIKIKELEKELEQAKKVQVVEHFEAYGQCRDSRRIASLEKENEELKERVKTLTIHDTNAVLNGLEMKVLKDSHRDRANKTQEQLTKAKKLIEKLLIVSCNSEVLIQYPNCKEVLETRVALEQFLREE